MDKERITNLFDEIIRVHCAIKEAEKEQKEAEEIKVPAEPDIVEDLDAWLAFKAARDAVMREREARLMKARKELKALKERLAELEKEWRALGLPLEIWFRYGEWGIGVAYTNWGGPHSYLVIQRWQDKMPSLDHRYYGD